MRKASVDQLGFRFHADGQSEVTPSLVAEAFDPTRLTQARQLKGMTKKELADAIGVTPAAIGQYETGSSGVRPELIPRLANVLEVPLAFFLAGRPHGNLDASMAHFRSLRSTRSYQRHKSISLVEQVWELTYALEKRIHLPWVDLPGFSGGEISPGHALPQDPLGAARALRRHWNLGTGPIPHLVRQMEARGIVVVIPPPDNDTITVDAFSTSRLQRPIVVLTQNRADDVYRHRFTAAHELGHLIIHGDVSPGDSQQEREADTFAAEFLTPRNEIAQDLPLRTDFGKLVQLQQKWGVSIRSLLYRCRELGFLSDSSATRAYQRLAQLQSQPGFRPEPVATFAGEQPIMLREAFRSVQSAGFGIVDLAKELAWKPERVRDILGMKDERPTLRLVPGGNDVSITENGRRPHLTIVSTSRTTDPEAQSRISDDNSTEAIDSR